MNIINPYQKGAVRTKEKFFGYKKQQAQMEKYVKESLGKSTNQHMIFMGEPSTGKTSFLNLTKQYCMENNLFTTLVDLKLESTCYDFFKDMFSSILDSFDKKLETENAKKMKKRFQRTCNIGDEGKSELDFAYEYYYWKQHGKQKDDYPGFGYIKDGLTTLMTFFKNDPSFVDSNFLPKIVILVDDFQKIVGLDEHGETKGNEHDSASLHKNGDSISDSLRLIIEKMDDEFLFIIATYPGILKDEKFEQPQKLFNRHFNSIDVNKYNDEKETRDLIIGCLKDLPDDHAWKVTYYHHHQEKGKLHEIIKNRYKTTEVEGDNRSILENFISYNIKAELNRLVEKVHHDADARPHSIKLQLERFFENFTDFQPLDKHLTFFSPILIDLNNNELLANIYRDVAKSFKRSNLPEYYDKYSKTEKLYLYLLTRMTLWNFGRIIKAYEFENRIKNCFDFIKEEMNLDAISDEKINDMRKQHPFLDEQLNKDDFELATSKFHSHGIINFDKKNPENRQFNLNIYDQNYLKYSLMGENFLPIMEFSWKARYHEEYKSILLNHLWLPSYSLAVPFREDKTSKEIISAHKMIFNDVKEISSVSKGMLRPDILSELYTSENIKLFKLTFKSDLVNIEKLFLGSDQNNEKLRKVNRKLLKNRINVCNRLAKYHKDNHNYDFSIEVAAEYVKKKNDSYSSIKYLALNKEIVESPYGYPITEQRFNQILGNREKYYDSWQEGDLDKAVKEISILVNELNQVASIAPKIKDDIMLNLCTEISNYTYLALINNDNKSLQKIFLNYSNWIEKASLDSLDDVYEGVLYRYNAYLNDFMVNDATLNGVIDLTIEVFTNYRKIPLKENDRAFYALVDLKNKKIVHFPFVKDITLSLLDAAYLIMKQIVAYDSNNSIHDSSIVKIQDWFNEDIDARQDISRKELFEEYDILIPGIKEILK